MFLVFIGGLLPLLLGSYYFFRDLMVHRPGWDAAVYVMIAEKYNQYGMQNVHEPLRTYGYPWLLSVVLSLADLLHLPMSWLIFLGQIVIYLAAVALLCRSLKSLSRGLSCVVYLVLCCNFFVFPYFPVTLTESVFISIFLAVIGTIIRVESDIAQSQSIPQRWLFLLSFLPSLGLVVRPAAIMLLIPVLWCYGRLLWHGKYRWREMALAVVAGVSPLGVQLALNVAHFNVVSILPVQDLGGMQIRWGIENIKFAALWGTKITRIYYQSAGLVDVNNVQLGIAWYFTYPVQGLSLIMMKAVAAFDFEWLVPYPYTKPSSPWALSLVSFTVLWFGAFGVVLHGITNRLPVLGSRYMPIVICAGWASVSLVSALELRFTLPILSYLLVVGSSVVYVLVRDGNKLLLWLALGGWACAMPLLFTLAAIVRTQAVFV